MKWMGEKGDLGSKHSYDNIFYQDTLKVCETGKILSVILLKDVYVHVRQNSAVP